MEVVASPMYSNKARTGTNSNPWRYAYGQEEQYRAIMRDDFGNSIRSESMFKVSFFEVFSLLPAEEHLWDDSTM
jgi:hypothetical protein